MGELSKVMNTLKITGIKYDHDAAKKERRDTDGHAIITVAKGGEEVDFKVDREFIKANGPKVGGWLIQDDKNELRFMEDHEFKAANARESEILIKAVESGELEIDNGNRPITEKEAFPPNNEGEAGDVDGEEVINENDQENV